MESTVYETEIRSADTGNFVVLWLDNDKIRLEMHINLN